MGFRLRAPTIVSEVIDGETIIIDMQSGNYFSTEAIGTTLWLAALAGHDRQALNSSIAEAYPGSDGVAHDVGEFFDLLVCNGLLIEDSFSVQGANADELIWLSGPYQAPKLEQHMDMQDLVMLDPIHDVDTIGWPTRREDTVPLREG